MNHRPLPSALLFSRLLGERFGDEFGADSYYDGEGGPGCLTTTWPARAGRQRTPAPTGSSTDDRNCRAGTAHRSARAGALLFRQASPNRVISRPAERSITISRPASRVLA